MQSPRHSSFLERHEFSVVIILLGISLLHGILNIFNLAYAGQDYTQHIDLLKSAREGQLFLNNTNPPGLYVLAALIAKRFSPQFMIEAVSGCLLSLNLIALLLWHYLLRKIIHSCPLRIATFAILTFLPVRTVVSIVLAADALTVLPVVMLIILVVWLQRAQAVWLQVVIALVAGAIWCAALYAKFTFFVLPIGIGVLCALWLSRRQSWASRGRFAASLLIGAAAPLYFGWWMYSTMMSSNSIHFRPTEKGHGMSLRALLWVQPKDTKIFSAPEFTCGQDMGEAVGLSYISLLHMGAFHDIWGFFQGPPVAVKESPRPIHACFARERTPNSKFLARLSILLSIPITLLALIGTIHQVFAGLVRNFKSPSFENDVKLAIALTSVAFCAAPIARLSYYETVYAFGYWTPRLILPSLLGFITLGFASLDEYCRQTRAWIAWPVLTYAATMSVIYVLML